jgi:hypothetical protein
MTTTTKFFNKYSNPITASQVQQMDSYQVHNFIDGRIKSKDFYIDGQLRKKSYYLDDDELLSHWVEAFTAKGNFSWSLFFNKEQSGPFVQWEIKTYAKTGELKYRNIVVLDEFDQVIFRGDLDLEHDNIMNNMQKHYYVNNPTDRITNELLAFTYNADGSFRYIHDVQNLYDHIKPLELEAFLADTKFSQQQFPWDQHPYYHAATPYLPEGDL